MIEVNSISKSNNKRNKRLLDIGISLLALLLSPVLLFLQDKKENYFLNCFNVLFGFTSWVGYGNITDKSLPEIKRSVLSPSMFIESTIDVDKIRLTNLRYAKDYSLEKDIILIWKGLSKLGN